jgi:hypothetical protein
MVAPHGIDGYGDIHQATLCGAVIKDKRPKNSGNSQIAKELLSFGLDYFFASIETIGANVMAQMGLPGGRLNRQRGITQKIVRTMHPAFRRGFFILLNSHTYSLTNDNYSGFIFPSTANGFLLE